MKGYVQDGKNTIRLSRQHLSLAYMLRITGGDPQGKIFKLLDFTDHPRDIADPWYTGDFETTYADVLEGCQALLEKLLAK